ncbi:MAG: crossover junction endodeoxyribonuclease RuvC [Nitrospinales bacterium]
MRVMGIDPGSLCTGYGIVDETGGKLSAVQWGGIRCRASEPFARRLKTIYDELTGLLREYQPDTVAVEDLFFAVNAQSALKLGQTRGVALLAAANENKPIGEYSPLAVKQSVAGYGRAAKEQVQSMVVRLLNLKEPPQPLDASDALAIAICHIHTANTQSRRRA